MTRFARHTVLVVALLLSGCKTMPPAVGDTMADAQSAAPVSTVSEADVRIPGFIRAMLERAPGAEYWLCRDESDWKHPGASPFGQLCDLVVSALMFLWS